MLTELLLPDLGLGSTPITLSLWLVKQGSRVAEGEPIAEILASCATVDLPSPTEGILVKKLVAEGDSIAIGQPLALIEND